MAGVRNQDQTLRPAEGGEDSLRVRVRRLFVVIAVDDQRRSLDVGAAAIGLTSSTRNLPASSASLNASAMFPLLAKNGARSMRGGAQIRERRHGHHRRDPSISPPPPGRATAAPIEIPITTIGAVGRGRARAADPASRRSRTCTRHPPIRRARGCRRRHVEPARHEVVRHPDSWTRGCRRRRGEPRRFRASPRRGTTSPSA